jgi:hypothetical protein
MNKTLLIILARTNKIINVDLISSMITSTNIIDISIKLLLREEFLQIQLS